MGITLTLRKEVNNVAVTEAETVRLGMVMAIRNGWVSIQVESDNQHVMNHLFSIVKEWRWETASICWDICSMKHCLRECLFTWVPRSANRLADYLAKMFF